MKFVRMTILALGLAIVAAATSFAAVPFFATSTNNVVAINAQTGLVGSILYTPLISGQAVTAGEVINITYPQIISYLLELQVTLKYTSAGTSYTEVFGAGNTGTLYPVTPKNAYTTYGSSQTSSSSGLQVTLNQTNILISFTKDVAFSSGDFLKIEGVRIDANLLNGTDGTILTAYLSDATQQATAQTASLQVGILREALATPTVTTVTSAGVLAFNPNMNAVNGQNIATITLSEVTPTSWTSANTSYPTWIILDFTGGMPAGFTITGATFLSVSGGGTYANGYGGTFPQGYQNKFTVSITNPNPNSYDIVQVGFTFGPATGTTSFPPAPAAISFTATLGLEGATYAPPSPLAGQPNYPYSTNGTWPQQYKFKSRPTTAKTIPINIIPLFSKLFVPYSQMNRNPSNPNVPFIYNTGFAVSNTAGSTTTYPAGNAGTLTVTLYPTNINGGANAAVTFTTSATKKLGKSLNSDGTLASGATWLVMLDELLSMAGYSSTADFYGFIRIQANFQGGQGVAYLAAISDQAGTENDWVSSVLVPMTSDQSAF